jgi:tetratricopeptide (TPR) repeat protein
MARSSTPTILLLGAVLFVVPILVVAFVILRNRPGDEPAPAPTVDLGAAPDYVGREACVDCHEEEHAAWRGSHHDLAMRTATEETVLGDFSGVEFTYGDVTSTFFRRDGAFVVRTDGPDGKLTEYPIAYTFGVEPLQQYLIAFPDGRYQALNVCWDTRPAEEGGQRWFHLYPDDEVGHEDPLHWTGLYQNWNYMCAECHSTRLRRGWDAAAGTYDTTWSEIDVSCEACHGPGSHHVAIAEAVERRERPEEDAWKGLVVRLRDPEDGSWTIDTKTGNATRSPPLANRTQLEVCARCHARRDLLTEDVTPGQPLLDTHAPVHLEEPLYHADGQILDEVYVYGSFLQSKMHGHGVRCVDCHDAHSYRLLGEGNEVCALCHLGTKFDAKSHHFHEPGTPGAMCIDCHAQQWNYMVVDPRLDHSFRIPRPDLSDSIGVPNACSAKGCHDDESNAWSATKMDEWYGEAWRKPHYGTVFHRARGGHPRAGGELAGLLTAEDTPLMVRATAAALLRGYPDRALVPALRQALEHPSPLVRRAAVGALEPWPPEARFALAAPRLRDDRLAVRVEAARILADIPRDRLTDEAARRLEAALADFEGVLKSNEDRPQAHLRRGVLLLARGRLDEAEEACRTAIRLGPTFGRAETNLADLHRRQGREDEAERVLREALARQPDLAALHHSLGLLLIRKGRHQDALEPLARAAGIEPTNGRYGYVHALALEHLGRRDEAIAVMEALGRRRPMDAELLLGRIQMLRSARRLDEARRQAERLVELDPENARFRLLLRSLR